MPDEATDDLVPPVTAEPETAPETEPTVEEIPVEEPPEVTKLINFTELKPGQTVRLHERIVDFTSKGEERKRVQVFEGMILGLRGAGVSRTLTIRKMSGTVAVEKIYPINSPVIVKIELVKTARVRRAKLSFLNNQKSKFKRKFKETYVSGK